MKKLLYAVFGASGFGREVMPLARSIAESRGCEVVFVDDAGTDSIVNNHRCMTFAEFVAEPTEQKYISLAIANSLVRLELEKRCLNSEIKFFEVKSHNVVVMDQVSISEGAILSPFVTLTSNAKIGRQFHANIYSYVAHDCVIGDYVTFAPRVHCNGNVHVKDHAYIGTGAIIKQGRPGDPVVIGEGAIIGMGAVVTKSVPAGVTVVGNPAKPMEKR